MRYGTTDVTQLKDVRESGRGLFKYVTVNLCWRECVETRKPARPRLDQGISLV